MPRTTEADLEPGADLHVTLILTTAPGEANRGVWICGGASCLVIVLPRHSSVCSWEFFLSARVDFGRESARRLSVSTPVDMEPFMFMAAMTFSRHAMGRGG
jgi:hypothetical protein